MGRSSDWALEVQEEQQIMDELLATHADTVEKVEKILALYPELIQNTTLELSLLNNIPIEQAETQAYEKVLDSICDILQPNNDKAFITVYRHLRKTSPNSFGVEYAKHVKASRR